MACTCMVTAIVAVIVMVMVIVLVIAIAMVMVMTVGCARRVWQGTRVAEEWMCHMMGLDLWMI